MSQQTLPGARHPHVRMPMQPRDPTEVGRAATPLELFFDLVVVVAVALAAERLHVALVDGLGFGSILSYLLVFFAIWWAWVNFTWFASAYDCDDVAYRLTVFVMMTGALVMAAGVPALFDERDFTLAVIGYVIMRIALVSLWIRVARDDAPLRATARRFAIGVGACQLGWLTLLLPLDIWAIAWLVLAPAELLVPAWAERAGRTSFHPEHIAERYGLFMIIVLGETVLAASVAIQTVIGSAAVSADLVAVIVGGLLILYSMWWIYFDRPEEHLLTSLPTAFVWSYLHLPIFAAVAAVGAGVVVAIEEATGHAHIGWAGVGAAVGIPLAAYLVSLWLLYVRVLDGWFHRLIVPVAAALVLGAVFAPAPVLVMGVLLAGLVAVKVAVRLRALAPARPAGPSDPVRVSDSSP